MKATLEFNLPEEQEEYENAVRAPKLKTALWNIVQSLRSIDKYEELSDGERKMIVRVREIVHEQLQDNEVDI